jgi:hypothetical protein
MSRLPETLRRDFGLEAVERVTFVQFSAEPFQYRDGVEFANGRRVLLQTLREGVEFQVLDAVRDEPVTTHGRLRVVWPQEEAHTAGRRMSEPVDA